jgi:hypothetical protein
VFDRPYAPSTLGSFLRQFAFGHVRQLDAVASRLLTRLHEHTPVLAGIDGSVMVDIDDTIIEVHGYAKQGSSYGYSGVRGLNTLIATVTTAHAAPVITGQRLRKGACGSARGAARMVADTLATVKRLRSPAATTKPLLRADSVFYGYPTVATALRGGADVSITVRLDPKVKAAIAAIPEDAWIPIEYTDAIYDENTHQWISRAEVAEIGFTAFSSRKTAEQVPGRLVVRRIPDLNPARSEGTSRRPCSRTRCRALVVIEGVGSYGAGLAERVSGGGLPVAEPSAMPAAQRRGVGKTDALDAVRIARSVLPIDPVIPASASASVNAIDVY